MARKRSAEDKVREANRRMTPSERQEGTKRRPDRTGAESLHMPRPASGRLLQDMNEPREASETARAAKRTAGKVRGQKG